MKQSPAIAILVFLGVLMRHVAAEDPAKIRTLPLRQIRVKDQFWAPKLQVCRERTIPHSWQYVDEAVGALRKAAGGNVADKCGCTWAEANLYKVLETAACSLAQFPDKELEKRVDEIVATLAKAQRPDGYCHAYVILAGKKPWDPDFLDGSHDGYVLGHLIQAAIEYQAATARRPSWILPEKPPTRLIATSWAPMASPASAATPNWKWPWSSCTAPRASGATWTWLKPSSSGEAVAWSSRTAERPALTSRTPRPFAISGRSKGMPSAPCSLPRA